MIKKIKSKTSVFIDGANIFYTQRQIGWNIDWKKTLTYLSDNYDIIESSYYTGVKDDDEKMKKFLNKLREKGINTVTKPLKLIKDQNNKVLYKSNCDVEMAVDILLSVNTFETLLLFSGDSDFTHLIKILQKQFQKQIIIYSSRKTISWEVKLAANKYYFLEDFKKYLKK